MTMTRDKIEELKQRISLYACAQVAGREDEAERVFAQIESLLALAERALEPQGKALPELEVWYGSMPESNGKSNFTATLRRKGASLFDTNSYTFARSEYPERVRYEADCMRFLIGETDKEPFILDYDADKHSGYVEPASQLALPAGPGTEDQMKSAIQELFDNAPYNDGVPFVRCSDVMDVIDAVYASPSPALAQTTIKETLTVAAEQPDPVIKQSLTTEVTQPVADERAEYERMLRAGYQHDNVRRQERGLASTDELTEGQEREIAERVALKFPSGAGLRKDSPVAFSCARRAAHPTSWTMTCDKHCGDDAKCFRAALCQPAEEGDKA